MTGWWPEIIAAKGKTMSDTKVFLSLTVPMRECDTCGWRGVILDNPDRWTVKVHKEPSSTPILEFEPEKPSSETPDIAIFCPACGENLKVRAE